MPPELSFSGNGSTLFRSTSTIAGSGVTSIGRYQIVQKLGQGGMGAVYQAFDPQIQRTVALKVISTHMVDRPDLRERFFREARAAGQLSHRNIITIFDMGDHEGQPYITMEFVDGKDLDWLMRHGEPISLARKLDIIADICDGLAYAHERGIIHRDVKPANVMLAPGGQIKILDFGLARVVSSDLTRSNMMFGTMEYMAPEQIRAEAVDHRADIFSVGALFYELISGRRAFQAETFAATMYRILQEVPAPLRELSPDLPPHVAAIVERALVKSRSERYQSMPEMLRAVRVARQTLETGAWAVEPLQGQSPAPLTPPDAPTVEVSRAPSPYPGAIPGAPPSPPPASPVPSAASSGPAPLMPPLAFLRRTSTRTRASTALVLLLLLAGGLYWRSWTSNPGPVATMRDTNPQGDTVSPGPGLPPDPSAERPPTEPTPGSPAPGSSAPGDEEPSPRRDPPPAPKPAPAPPPPAPAPQRADAATRARARAALEQMLEQRTNAESTRAPDLVPEAYRRAAALERDARDALGKGDYLHAVASAQEARASYLLAATEAGRVAAEQAAQAKRAATRQAALDQLPEIRRSWGQMRQAAERAGASTAAGTELAQAIERVARVEGTADRDPEAALREYRGAISMAQHARDAAAARKAAEAAAATPPAKPPAPSNGAEAARREVDELLQRYVSALQGRDLEALKRIWPSLPSSQERAIRDEFTNARAIRATLASPRVEINGDRAVVVGRRDYEIETRDGQQLRTATRTTIQLRRSDDQWLIESIRYEPLQ